jgi:hypothetical protein
MQIRTADGAVRLIYSLENGECAPDLVFEDVEAIFLEALVVVENPDLRLSSKQCQTLLANHPTLGEHACRQQGLGRFADKIATASLPHIVEHLAIDSLVQTHHQPIAGNTIWQQRAANKMMIRLQIPNVILPMALKAVDAAICEVCTLLEAL